MCIGVPGQIRTIDGNQAKVDVCGIQRDVDLTLVGSCDENGQPRGPVGTGTRWLCHERN